MNFNHGIRAAALAVALTAIPATPASAAGGVPAGQIEHTVTTRTFGRIAPDYQLVRSTVTEDWVGASSSHSLDRMAKTGALMRECASKGNVWSCFYPSSNLLEKGFRKYLLLPPSWAQMARSTAWTKDHYHYQKVGTGTDIGRPVDVYHATRHLRRGNGLDVDETIDIDQATGYPLRWVTDETGGGHTTRQTTTVTTFERLDASAVSMAMAKHPGAKVRVVQPRQRKRATRAARGA